MIRPSDQSIKVAVLDLNNGETNLGLAAINAILQRFSGKFANVHFDCEVFDVRQQSAVPNLDFDVYVSSGGPGSPYDGAGSEWERDYFSLIDGIWNHNQQCSVLGQSPKHMLFICHSYQIMVRHFRVAEVTERHSPSFGVFPVHLEGAGFEDPLFAGLDDPFYAADFRHWQVVQPDVSRLSDLGAEVLALEKIRPDVDLERATMAIRISPEMVGVQFHPEADPVGMLYHFEQPQRLRKLVEDHGYKKYSRIIKRLDDPQYLARTYAAVIPNFLHDAVGVLRGDEHVQLT